MRRFYLAGLVTSFVLYYVTASVAFSQEKWGEVSDEVLKMAAFDQDSTANAIFLFDVAQEKIAVDDGRFSLEMDRHVRIKILTEKGKEYADIKIPYYYEDDVKNIEAQTFLTSGKKIKLNKKNIHEEEVRKYYKQKVFAFPGVEVGSVIEYKYRLRSKYLTFLEPWFFQNDEYTLVSQLSVILQQGFGYNVFFQNMVGESTKPVEEEFLVPGVITRKGKKYVWHLENIPSLHGEKFMRNIDDYRMAMEFQLTEYKDPYNYIKFIKNWDDLAETVRDEYKDFMKADDHLRQELAGVISDSMSPAEQIQNIYEFVRDGIETQWHYRIWMENSPEDILEKRTGTLCEKNMLLISLLRSAGYEACPLLISTRSNGRMKPAIANLSQFNHVLVCVSDGTDTYYLDTCDRFCPFGSVPVQDIVEYGLVIRKKGCKIESLPQSKVMNMLSYDTSGELLPDGALRCQINIRHEGYEALKARKKIANVGLDEYGKDLITDIFAGSTIDTVYMTGFEDEMLPLGLSIVFHVPDYAQVAGNMIYFIPPQVGRLGENPFKREQRNYPVEFPYLSGIYENIKISLPEGYAVEELPSSQIYRMDGLLYMADCKSTDSTVTFQKQYMIRKNFFKPEEYPDIRNIHSRIVNFEENQVVLKNGDSSM
jgi:hypothetical protein